MGLKATQRYRFKL